MRLAALCFTLILFFSQNYAQRRNTYFYKGLKYGSESAYNPVTYILNGGFDILQVSERDRNIFKFPFAESFDVTWTSIAHPFEAVKNYGTGEFITSEVFPVSLSAESGQWVPNYLVHLIGGGMSFAALDEWYEHHDFPIPKLFSAATIAVQHLLNEVVENYPKKGWNVDPVADIYIFDLAGAVLFSFDGVRNFFGNDLHLRDWSNQPTFTAPRSELHNVGQYFTMKLDIPFWRDNSLFANFGMGGLLGLSHKINSTDAISIGGGVKTVTTIKVQDDKNKYTVGFKWSVGFFYDRNNSLLLSVKFNGVKDYFCNINLYPGIINFKGFSPGIWTLISLNGKIGFGITTKYAVSFGYY